MKLLVLAKRISDGALFEPSFPDGYSSAVATADMLRGNRVFYFRRIVGVPKKWYQRADRYERTGEVWEPENSRYFEVVYDVPGIINK